MAKSKREREQTEARNGPDGLGGLTIFGKDGKMKPIGDGLDDTRVARLMEDYRRQAGIGDRDEDESKD